MKLTSLHQRTDITAVFYAEFGLPSYPGFFD